MGSESLKNLDDTERELLVIDNSYTYEMIVERGIQQSIICRDLNGYFNHVWSVHPFATLLTSDGWSPKFGKPKTHNINDRHTFIEGKVGLFHFRIIPGSINFLFSQIHLLYYLYRLIKIRNIKVIRVGDPLLLGIYGLILSKLSGVPFLIRVNGNNERVRIDTKRPLYPQIFRSIKIERAIEKFIFPRANLVVAPNKDNRNFAIEFGSLPTKTKIFPYGNLLAPIHFDDPFSRTPNLGLFKTLSIQPYKFLLIVGRLQKIKFPEDSLKILKTIRDFGIDHDLVIAGEGEMLQDLIDMSVDLRIDRHVYFIGNQNQETLSQLYSFASVVISPLTGRALSEAALCGASVVAYDLDWQSEIIINNKTGYLVPFREVDSMAKATYNLISDINQALLMRKNLRNHAFDLLNPQKLNNKEIITYQELLSDL